MDTISISADVTVTLDAAGVPTRVVFEGDEVVDDSVSDDSVSYVLSEIQRRTGHKVQTTVWAGPFPGQGRNGSDRVEAKLVAR